MEMENKPEKHHRERVIVNYENHEFDKALTKVHEIASNLAYEKAGQDNSYACWITFDSFIFSYNGDTHNNEEKFEFIIDIYWRDK